MTLSSRPTPGRELSVHEDVLVTLLGSLMFGDTEAPTYEGTVYLYATISTG